MADVATCTITEDGIRRAWRDSGSRGDPPADLVARLRGRATMIEGAMEDAGLALAHILLVDMIAERRH